MPTILIIDDDPDILRVLAAAFEGAGHEVCATTASEAATQLARARRCDAVVLDVMMPRRSGWEVLAELRQERRTERLPVLMLSAIGEPDDRIRGIRSGADDFLVKPFHGAEVVARVEALIARRAAAGQGLQGDFATLAPGDLLQHLEQSAASGELELATPAGDGLLRFATGRCLEASFAGLAGGEAVLALIEQTAGSFRLRRESPPASAGPPLPQVTVLLLGAAWIADELRQRRASLPLDDCALAVAPGVRVPAAPDGLPELPLAAAWLAEAQLIRVAGCPARPGREGVRALADQT
jgi:CheY-like chemotaxis protein